MGDTDAADDPPAAGASTADDREPEDGEQQDRDQGQDQDERELAELRAAVEEKYDFEDFGPEQMAEMSVEEWEAAFDPDSWITGTELLDRLDQDLRRRIADRDVFARLMRVDDPERLIAYSDEGYAVVYGDGSLEGYGTVLRDVKPSVALCSMDEYDVPEAPEGETLPRPRDVPEGTGDLGNKTLQAVAVVQVLVGVVLIALAFAGVLEEAAAIGGVAGLGFIFIGVVLLLVVANARLSDKFRAEEYRNRLRAVGIDADEPPAFLLEALEENPRLEPALEEEFGEVFPEAFDGESDSEDRGA